MSKENELYVEKFTKKYLENYNLTYETVVNERKDKYIYRELLKKCSLEFQKSEIDDYVGCSLGTEGRNYLENLAFIKWHEDNEFLYTKKEAHNPKEGDVYSFKLKKEQYYRYIVYVTDEFFYGLKYKSTNMEINFTEVGWSDILTKSPSIINFGEKIGVLTYVDNVKINKKELDFIRFPESEQYFFGNLEGKCYDIFGKIVNYKRPITFSDANSFCISQIYNKMIFYEKFIEELGEEVLKVFQPNSNWWEILDEKDFEEIKEVPKEMMDLVLAVDMPKEKRKYVSPRVRKEGDEYSFFLEYDEYIEEVIEEIGEINKEVISSEEMTGENLEVLIRYYLTSQNYDLSHVTSDSDTDIVALYSKEGKEFRTLMKETNKFLRNKKKLLIYVKENINDIDWE